MYQVLVLGVVFYLDGPNIKQWRMLSSGMQRMQYIHVTDTTTTATAFVWNSPATAFQGLPVAGLAGAGAGDHRLVAHSTECLLRVSGYAINYSGYTFMYAVLLCFQW